MADYVLSRSRVKIMTAAVPVRPEGQVLHAVFRNFDHHQLVFVCSNTSAADQAYLSDLPIRRAGLFATSAARLCRVRWASTSAGCGHFFGELVHEIVGFAAEASERLSQCVDTFDSLVILRHALPLLERGPQNCSSLPAAGPCTSQFFIGCSRPKSQVETDRDCRCVKVEVVW